MSPKPVFRSTSDNAAPELVELTFDAGQGSSARSVIVLADVLFGRAREPLTHQTVEYEVGYAELRLKPGAGKIKTTSRFGNHVLPNQVPVTFDQARASESQLSAEGKLETSGGKPPKASFQFGKRRTASQSERTQYVTADARVRPKGNLKWDISELDTRNSLQGRYIGDDPLCVIDADQDIEILTITLLVPKRHFKIVSITDNITGEVKHTSTARRKVLEALSSRAFAKEGDGLVMSQGELTRAR